MENFGVSLPLLICLFFLFSPFFSWGAFFLLSLLCVCVCECGYTVLAKGYGTYCVRLHFSKTLLPWGIQGAIKANEAKYQVPYPTQHSPDFGVCLYMSRSTMEMEKVHVMIPLPESKNSPNPSTAYDAAVVFFCFFFATVAVSVPLEEEHIVVRISSGNTVR